METLTEVKERPILFQTEMVKAILEGRKTVTRRIVSMRNSSFEGTFGGWPSLDFSKAYVDGDSHLQYLHVPNPEWETSHRVYPKYDPKDVLWVRETWSKIHYEGVDENPTYLYKADGLDVEGIWKPSIHMPRAACRLRLEIQSIRVERLQDISEEDAVREGVEKIEFNFPALKSDPRDKNVWQNYLSGPRQCYKPSARESFISLWQSINGLESWEGNPFCWVINFRKL